MREDGGDIDGREEDKEEGKEAEGISTING
jgi:hypothetical protein